MLFWKKSILLKIQVNTSEKSAARKDTIQQEFHIYIINFVIPLIKNINEINNWFWSSYFKERSRF